MGMVQGRDRACLALKALGEFALGDLQRDDAVQARVAGLPHLAHAAFAQQRHNLVGAEFVASRQHNKDVHAIGLHQRECSRLEAAPKIGSQSGC